MLLLLPLHLIQPNTLYTQMNAKNVSFSVSSQTTSAHCECVHLCGAAHSTLYLLAILIGFCFASWPARTPPYLPVSSSSNQSHFHPLCKLCVYQQQEVLHSRAHRNRARDVHRRRRRRHQFNWLCGSSPWIFRLRDCESISINLHVNTHSLSLAHPLTRSTHLDATPQLSEWKIVHTECHRYRRTVFGIRDIRRRPTGDTQTKWIKKFSQVHQDIREITRRYSN